MTVIAMTREIGSLGTEVAARVGKRLGLEIVRSEVAATTLLAGSASRRAPSAVTSTVRHPCWNDGRSIVASSFIMPPKKFSAWPSAATC